VPRGVRFTDKEKQVLKDIMDRAWQRKRGGKPGMKRVYLNPRETMGGDVYHKAPKKYLGHYISGGPGLYWSYVAGQDIQAKTITELKRKIHKLEYGI